MFFAVDSSSAKALLEFATVDQAEKGWASPKLGKGISSLSPAQLKGKSREDLIRVWWYRASSPELIFTRKELEEGEIEDDEALIDGRKESKKEKRARLAKAAKDEKDKQRTTEHHRGDQTKITTLSPSSSSSIPPGHGVSSSSVLPSQPFNAIAPPPTMTWQLPSTTYMPPMPPSVPFRSHTSLPSESLVPSSPPLPALWHRAAPENAFMGPLPGHRYSTHFPVTEIGNPPENHADDIDMELSSPTLQSSLVPFEVDEAATAASSTIEDSSVFASSSTMSPAAVHEISAYVASPPPESPPGLCAPPTPPMSPKLEPVVTKAIPIEPSYIKRTLLARQKELEERIARSKLELEQNRPSTGRESLSTPAPSHSEPASNPLLLSPNLVSEVTPDKQVMEDRLRSLVLASKRNRKKTDVPVSTQPSITDDSAGTNLGGPLILDPIFDSSSGNRTPTPFDSVLDDLAVSFIQESIQTIKPAPLPTPTTQVPLDFTKPLASDSSVGLAARREQLEYQITETKRLMGLLSLATTKQRKDSIMGQIRELNRCVSRIIFYHPLWLASRDT